VILPWPFGGYSDPMLLDNASGEADRMAADAATCAATGAAASAVTGAVAGPGAASRLRPPQARREHFAEVSAVSRLLGRRRFGRAVYVGGGYDRFSQVLRGCADHVTVAAPGPLDVDDACADLAVMVSALQERADPADDFAEIARVLRPGALAVIAAASVLHGPGRARYRRSGAAITGSPAVTGGRLGHHPETLMLQLAVSGLRVERLLSCSGQRHPVLDRVLPGPVRRAAEFAAQAGLAAGYFGPTLYFLARKRDLA
jgi:SAM-dependent methyltransferase